MEWRVLTPSNGLVRRTKQVLRSLRSHQDDILRSSSLRSESHQDDVLRGVRTRYRRGISLLEAVVAIAIVGITSVSALEAVGGDMRTAERARRAIVVEALAGSRLEFMDLLTDRELQALPDSVESGKFPAPLDEYSWKTTSAPVSDQAGSTPSRGDRLGERLVRRSGISVSSTATGDAPMMRARRGMTLMELVIGLAITGMMATASAAVQVDHRSPRVVRTPRSAPSARRRCATCCAAGSTPVRFKSNRAADHGV
jgi:prepilin-type N-terminal cleavage/methylation domain-containing protein